MVSQTKSSSKDLIIELMNVLKGSLISSKISLQILVLEVLLKAISSNLLKNNETVQEI
eukprot:Pgem_evm1s10960